ncbi:hypothetical protein WH95_10790 [Kiloniella litopenaei]|uniref:DUF2971 domain-containing protein n=1 Tax=Kiloniella litopenaei TaxID=1549748 RepID=A0A0M2RBA5_9PROT|nr:DUF2971 domain-containing protein [Kiloniella litopenaei]KKJ76903.1 hypothetical protein WH95_10790 [Kiloniella litopenaei]
MSGISIRRYTNLAATIHILKNRNITLLDPNYWDDKNDSYFMDHYKKQKNLQTLLALCFAEDAETYHHWKVFSSGSDGVCIEFNKEELIHSIKKTPGISYGVVDYIPIKKAKTVPLTLDKLPFTKRYPYKPENEFRIVYQNKGQYEAVKDIPMPLSTIKRITLSPWLPKALRNSTVDTLKTIKGCSKLKIYRTTLLENDQWKKLVDHVSK